MLLCRHSAQGIISSLSLSTKSTAEYNKRLPLVHSRFKLGQGPGALLKGRAQKDKKTSAIKLCEQCLIPTRQGETTPLFLDKVSYV
jgi:hypothetical protein